MSKHPEKREFPVSQVRRYLEPGPIVLVSSRWAGQSNIMTLGWHTVLEFTPSLVGCMIAGGNYSFAMVRNSRECVINLPTTALTDQVVGIGNTSGRQIDKFAAFGLRGCTRIGFGGQELLRSIEERGRDAGSPCWADVLRQPPDHR